jgi:hypothetical protein
MLTGTFMLSCNTSTSEKNNDSTLAVQDIAVEGAEQNKVKASELADTTVLASPPVAPEVLHAGSPGPDWDKKIIKTANITLELKDFDAYNTSLRKNIKGYGAYIAAEEQVQIEDKIENEVTIKVPVMQFDELINSFNGSGIKIINKRISTEDVTGEVVDTKARIDAKKHVRESYLGLLKQAKNMKDILQVQNEINSIQEELETADGRVKYLTNQSAYSTVHLVYYQFINGASGGNSEPGFFTKLQSAFTNGGYIMSGGILFLVTIWPLLVFGVAVWFLLKRWKPASISAKKV